MKKFIWFMLGLVAGFSYLVTFIFGGIMGFALKNEGPKRESYYMPRVNSYTDYYYRHKEDARHGQKR